MIEYCSSKEFEFKQDISSVVFDECYSYPNRLSKLLRREKRRGKLRFSGFLVPRQQTPSSRIKLFEPCFHQRVPRRLWSLLYTFPFPFPFHFIIPYCYFVHGMKTYILFFFSPSNQTWFEKRKKKETLSNYKRKFSSNFPFDNCKIALRALSFIILYLG